MEGKVIGPKVGDLGSETRWPGLGLQRGGAIRTDRQRERPIGAKAAARRQAAIGLFMRKPSCTPAHSKPRLCHSQLPTP